MLEMRKEFVANASHELKTPITIIQGFAETLHDTPDLPPEMISEITAKIVRNSKRMSNLIKDLLALSDVENLSKSRLIELDLLDLTENCAQLLKDAHPNAIIEIKTTSDEKNEIIGDPHLMELAVMNLIENAAKYSTPPAHIEVTLENQTDWIVLTVADNGIGIPPEDLEHIFERFYTVDKAHSRKMGGS